MRIVKDKVKAHIKLQSSRTLLKSALQFSANNVLVCSAYLHISLIQLNKSSKYAMEKKIISETAKETARKARSVCLSVSLVFIHLYKKFSGVFRFIDA